MEAYLDAGLWVELRQRIYAISLGLTGCPTDAEDLTQDACLKIFLKSKQFRGDSQLFTWAYSIVRNSWRDRCRQLKQRQDYVHGYVNNFFDNHTFVPDFSDTVVLRMVMDQLPTLHKKVLLLKEYGNSYNEIAQITRTSLDSVKSRMYSSRRMLNELMKK